MIDAFSETLLTLAEAARLVPKRRAGRKCNLATLYRWTADGCRGIKLESLQVGGTRVTSKEALSRFFLALTDQAGVAPAPTTRTAIQRLQASKRAGRRLEAAGI